MLYVNGGSLSINGADFFARGKELGLSTKEIRILKKAADYLKLERPLTLLGSTEHLDCAISRISLILEKEGYSNIEVVDLLDELYNFKKKIEITKRDRINAIESTREIDTKQQVKVVPGSSSSPFIGTIIENDTDYLLVDFSLDPNFPANSRFDGAVNVYFWKQGDAGYYFETVIIDGSLNRKWKIAHSNSLIRNQKRVDFRVDVDVPGYVYKLTDISKRNNKKEGFTGTFVQLKNISDRGAALLINGRVSKGEALKLEFKLLKKHIVLNGILIETQYDSRLNCSLLRFKFIEPDIETLYSIRSFIYNINNEQDKIKEDNIVKSVENRNIINNNNNSEINIEEEVSEVEYLPEECEVLN